MTLLGQEGDLPWEQTPAGLKIDCHPEADDPPGQGHAGPGPRPRRADIQRLTWGPDWPVAVKITGLVPVVGPGK